MSQNDEVYGRLAERFPGEAHKTLERAGGQTYVPWNLVAERLNTVLGVENWSFRVIREGFTSTECWALGELKATIRGVETVRQQYGVSPLTMGQKEAPVDDLMKKVGTDALKKCAQVLGVALYLTDADERREVQAEMREAKRQGPTPIRPPAERPQPTPQEQARAERLVPKQERKPVDKQTRPELIATFSNGVKAANAVGADWPMPTGTALELLDDDDLRSQIKDIASAIRKAKAAG